MKKNIKWLKEEVNKALRDMESDGISYYDYTVLKKSLNELINQLDEPEVLSRGLPVIPRFVADYLCRAKADVTLMRVLEIANTRNELPKWKREYDWISANDETFARAWLDGFTVEEEQKYYVINNDQRMMLVRMMDGKTITEADPFKIEDMYEVEKKSHRLTEQEIKDYDERYIPFMVPVDEVNND